MSNKSSLKQLFVNYFLIIFGTFVMTFGTVIFLTKCELVAGGISGIAIIIQHAVPDVKIYDYVVTGLTIFFWFIGLIFVGKKFAFRTLVSSICYIGFTFLCTRSQALDQLATEFAGITTTTPGNMIICGIFGGVFIGFGVALTFLGGGSSGGVDCLQYIGYLYFNIRESLTSFVVDSIIIIAGMIAMKMPIQASCGIISSFATALLIEFVYIRNQTAYQVDVISDKWEDISQYVQNTMERGATIIHVNGGYKNEERVMLRVVITKWQYERLRKKIAEIDSKAFVTFTQTNAVFGEGFRKNANRQSFLSKHRKRNVH